MANGTVGTSACSDLSYKDLVVQDCDFESFVNWGSPEAMECCDDAHQSPGTAFPAGKKRCSNNVPQIPVKKIKLKHSHVCDIHQPPSSKPSVRCFGQRSRTCPGKDKRCERMIGSFVDEQLPVCQQHSAQVLKMVRCEATLECGLPCNEITPWEPHGYPLCEVHWWKGKCWIMELPPEIRCAIYQYLITDQPVQARRYGANYVRRDRATASTAIFRTNKTIYEEVVDLFYGESTFHIDVTNEQGSFPADTPGIFMCYAKKLNASPAASDIMLSRLNRQNASVSSIRHLLTPWQPSLALRNFQRIRHLQINIKFDIPRTYVCAMSSSRAQNAERNRVAEKTMAEAERNLLCDYLHRLVERLASSDQATLSNLDICLYIRGISDYNISEANSEAAAHCRALINPIRRLRSRNASLVSVNRNCIGGKGINILLENLEDEDSLHTFVLSCCIELTSSLVSPPRSPVHLQFSRLARIISEMSQHPFWRETDREELGILLNNGRAAREANDMKAMKSVFRGVFHKMNKYHSDHQDFMDMMKRACGAG